MDASPADFRVRASLDAFQGTIPSMSKKIGGRTQRRAAPRCIISLARGSFDTARYDAETYPPLAAEGRLVMEVKPTPAEPHSLRLNRDRLSLSLSLSLFRLGAKSSISNPEMRIRVGTSRKYYAEPNQR